MYTEEMSKAFHSHKAPDGFSVDIIDYNDFIAIKIDPENLSSLSYDVQVESVKYINAIKKSFEELGALVWITRDAIGEESAE